MPLLYPYNKLDYNNDSIISASKIVSARSRERMTDPLRDPDASVLDSMKKSEKVSESINQFKLSAGQLRDLVRAFKSRALDAVSRGEFETAVNPYQEEIPEPEQEEIYTQDPFALLGVIPFEPPVPSPQRLPTGFVNPLDLFPPQEANPIQMPFIRTQRDEGEEEGLQGLAVFDPEGLAGYGRRCGGAGGRLTEEESRREIELSKRLAKDYAQAFRIYQSTGGEEVPDLITEMIMRLGQLQETTRDRRKLKVIDRALQKLEVGERLTATEAKYALPSGYPTLTHFLQK